MLWEERTMSSPGGVLAMFLCSSLFGSCHARALTTNTATTKIWSQLEDVSESAERNPPSDLPLWTAWAPRAHVAATASPPDLWTLLSANSEEIGTRSEGSQWGVVTRPSSELKSAKSAVEDGTFHFAEPDSPSLTERLVNGQSDWADEVHMSDLYSRHAPGDSSAAANADTSSLAAEAPMSTAAPQDRSEIDTASSGTVAPPVGFSVTPDLATSIPARALHSDVHGPAASDVTDTGLDTDDATDSLGGGTEVMTSVLHVEDSAIRPTEELAFIANTFAGRPTCISRLHLSNVSFFHSHYYYRKRIHFPCKQKHNSATSRVV